MPAENARPSAQDEAVQFDAIGLFDPCLDMCLAGGARYVLVKDALRGQSRLVVPLAEAFGLVLLRSLRDHDARPAIVEVI